VHLDERTMPSQLLAYLSSDFSAEDVVAVRDLVSRLGEVAHWSSLPPRFVDETDSTSCTRPEDKPIRTVGTVLCVSSPGELPETTVEEVRQMLDALARLSAERNLALEVQLGDTFVGSIEDGTFDRLLREGLIESW
jgi:hypothetical protein